MAEASGIIRDIVDIMRDCTKAVNAMKGAPEVYRGILEEHQACMGALATCKSIVQTVEEREDAVPDTVLRASGECASLGAELASPEEIKEATSKQPVQLTTEDWNNIKARYGKFRTSVVVLHNLAQNLQKDQSFEDQTRPQNISNSQGISPDQYCVCDPQHPNFAKANLYSATESAGGGSTFTQEILQHTYRRTSTSQSSSFTCNPSFMSTSQISDGIGSSNALVGVDRSIVDSTITVIHESKPRYISARAKYDTGSDANFTSSAFVANDGLSALQRTLKVPKVFVGLNEQEYLINTQSF